MKRIIEFNTLNESISRVNQLKKLLISSTKQNFAEQKRSLHRKHLKAVGTFSDRRDSPSENIEKLSEKVNVKYCKMHSRCWCSTWRNSSWRAIQRWMPMFYLPNKFHRMEKTTENDPAPVEEFPADRQMKLGRLKTTTPKCGISHYERSLWEVCGPSLYF